jgi:hypothetical protein
MAATITIAFSDEVLRALRSGKPVTLSLVGGQPGGAARAARGARGRGGRGGRGKAAAPREGSLPARILEWAKKVGKNFTTADIEKQFKLSRAHASMLLSRLSSGAFPIQRASRGLYRHR